MTTKIVRFQEPVWVGGLEQTPVGPVSMSVTARGLVRVEFTTPDDLAGEQMGVGDPHEAPDFLAEILSQMEHYLNGQGREFHVPIDWRGLTPFDQRVLQANLEIRYGQVVTYTGMAQRAGCEHAIRAVGTALGRNPMPIVIPCHRVVALDRRLNKYGAPEGIRTKAWLLELEGSRVVAGKLVSEMSA
jgi:methylated-DNA-[protein]-cysteine S-methyltransferase